MVTIFQAKVSDADQIMRFINDKWKEGHILSHHKEFFLYEFSEGDNLNFIIAKDEQDNIQGIYGFIKYNSMPITQIAGSIWKVDPKCMEPLLGLKLKEYCLKNIPNNFYGAPGAGIQTKRIHKISRLDWNQMEQYYFVNQNSVKFNIAKNPNSSYINQFQLNTDIKITKANTIKEIQSFNFEKENDFYPIKDLAYIERRFFNHPIYTYDIYYLTLDNEIKNIFICRTTHYNNNYAYRIVDFYGEDTYLGEISFYLKEFIETNNFEYLDFVSLGMNQEQMQKAGFHLLDFANNETIIPNYFEPFMQENTPIYCVSDKIEKRYRQFKADADQDRPSIV